jgi:hypothetical protein
VNWGGGRLKFMHSDISLKIIHGAEMAEIKKVEFFKISTRVFHIIFFSETFFQQKKLSVRCRIEIS